MSTMRSRTGFTPVRVAWAGLVPLVALGALAPAQARAAEAALRVVGLRTEYKENPLGIDTRKPRLSWRLESDGARRRPVGLRDPRGAERAGSRR